VFVLVCAGAGLGAARVIAAANEGSFFADPFHMVILSVFLGLVAIVLDSALARRSPATLGAVFVGIIVGGVLALFAANAVSVLFPASADESYAIAAKLLAWEILTYLSVSIILQTKDNLLFVIPYVEFHRQTRGERPIFLDTSAIIDGRIADLAETGILQDPLVVPSFVLSELQAVADSSIRARRVRGRRGLDILAKLRNTKGITVKIVDSDGGDEPVDQRLIKLAAAAGGRMLTTDYNLNKLAEVHGIEVINLNDMANSLKPVVIPGESLKVTVIKPGEAADQGVGFLDDGTMVVVENGRSRINKSINVTVTSVLQTSAGRMIFGKPEG
jgi:uncharacterized protein YacL